MPLFIKLIFTASYSRDESKSRNVDRGCNNAFFEKSCTYFKKDKLIFSIKQLRSSKQKVKAFIAFHNQEKISS